MKELDPFTLYWKAAKTIGILTNDEAKTLGYLKDQLRPEYYSKETESLFPAIYKNDKYMMIWDRSVTV